MKAEADISNIQQQRHEAENITEIIRERRSIFADDYTDDPIPQSILEEILTNALWAPTHKMTQPWRFLVLGEQHKQELGQYLADYYYNLVPEGSFPPEKYERLLHYPFRAACLLGIVMQRSTKIEIPEWEELAAVSCAVQNMHLTCTAYNIGGYWESCDASIAYGNGLGLHENEYCLGFFFMGYYRQAAYYSKKKRTPVEKKVDWLD